MIRKGLFVCGVVMLLLAVGLLGGCETAPEPEPEPPEEEETAEVETYAIGIVQFVEHPALDAVRQGILDALADEGLVEGDNLAVDYKNAQAEPATCVTISEGFVSDGVDLIVAIATPAVQAAATAATEIPVVFAAVTEPQEAGVVESWDRPNTNVTGVSDLNPVKELLEMGLEIVPGAENMGVIYNTGEVNSVVQVELAKEAAQELGVNIVESVATHTGEVGTAAEALIGNADLIWIPTDNTAITAFHSIVKVMEDSNIPVIGASTEFAELGAVAAIGFDYYDLGYQAGILAAEVLRGADPAVTPVQLPTEIFYAINPSAAEGIGIELPQALVDRAELVYE